MEIADVMQELADRLDTIEGLHVFAWPRGSITQPAAIVSYPEDIEYDRTYSGDPVSGVDTLTLPVVVLLGRPDDRSTRDRISAYSGRGPSSIKRVIETGTYTAFDVVHVAGGQFDPYTVGAVTYMAAVFVLQIGG